MIPHSSAALPCSSWHSRTPTTNTDVGLQLKIHVEEVPLETRRYHDMHAKTMHTTRPSREDARSTLVAERTNASMQHAQKQPPRKAARPWRLREKKACRGAFRGTAFSGRKSGGRKMCISKRRASCLRAISGPREAGGPFRATARSGAKPPHDKPGRPGG